MIWNNLVCKIQHSMLASWVMAYCWAFLHIFKMAIKWKLTYKWKVLCSQTYFGRHIYLSHCPPVSLSVRRASCPVLISYIIWGRNPKFSVWMHLGMAECRVPWKGHCDLDLDLWPSFQNTRVRSIFPIIFEVEIRNSVCACILHLRMAECCKPPLGHFDLNLWPSY